MSGKALQFRRRSGACAQHLDATLAQSEVLEAGLHSGWKVELW